MLPSNLNNNTTAQTVLKGSKADKKLKHDSLIHDLIQNKDMPYAKKPLGNYEFKLDSMVSLLIANKIAAIATGSRVFECASSSSDYDIIIPLADVNEASSVLKTEFGYSRNEDSDYHNGIKIYFANFDAKCINLIPLNPHEYMYWKLTTETIKNACRIDPSSIKNKTTRVCSFELLIGVFRLILGNNVDESTLRKYEKIKEKDENIIYSKIMNRNSKKAINDN